MRGEMPRRAAWDKVGVSREELMDVALGHEPADVAIINGTIVNVHTGTLMAGDIAIKGNRVAAVGDLAYAIGPATEVVNAKDRYVSPGLVDPHIHQWHTNHNGTVFARCLLEHGTTAAADGFYGAGIVGGVKGIRFFLDEVLATPLKLIFLVPTYSYAQSRAIGFPPAPGSVTADEMLEMIEWEEAWGVEETGYELLVHRDSRDSNIARVVSRALELRKVVTGHGPSFPSAREINAWIAAGVMSNHELVSLDDAILHAELGLYTLLREGAGFHEMHEVVRAITDYGYDSRAYQMCPDLATAETIFEPGQLDAAIRKAIRCGLSPIRAIQLATIQPAEFFRVNHEMGVIAPGRFADLVLLTDLSEFVIDTVMANGRVCVHDGEAVELLPEPSYPEWLYQTMHVTRSFSADDFRVPAPITEGVVKARVIGIKDGSYSSEELHAELPVKDGEILSDSIGGINKVVLVDRLHGHGQYGVGFVHGFGLITGAMGSSANPLEQGVVSVAATDQDMATAVNAVVERKGALVAVRGGEVVADFPAPLLGLVSDLPYEDAKVRVRELVSAWRELGCALLHPFAFLEFVAAATVPALRISTQGLTRVRIDAGGRVGAEIVSPVVS